MKRVAKATTGSATKSAARRARRTTSPSGSSHTRPWVNACTAAGAVSASG